MCLHDTTKHCPKCGQDKPHADFGKNRARADGLQTYCKACFAVIDKARNQNPERMAARAAYKRATPAARPPRKAANEQPNTQEREQLRTAVTKVCRGCGTEKPKADYTHDDRYRDGCYPWCAECRRVWRQNRREHQRDLERQWEARNPEKVKAKARRVYQRRKGVIAPKRRERDRERWHNDPAYRAKKNQWKKERAKIDPNFRRKRKIWAAFSRTRRRDRDQGVENTLTYEEWEQILTTQDHRCLACGKAFGPELPPTKDHIIPLSKGQGLTKENCQALCRPCNSRKHTKVIDYRNRP